jgi:hypothetical protein
MARHVFMHILFGVRNYGDYFHIKRDVVGMLGYSSYQKCTADVRMLAYGIPGDLVDESMRMSESTCLEAMYRFFHVVVHVFGTQYLRRLNVQDTVRLLSINESRGFSGMVGSIDCMNWEWKSFPFA